MTDLNTELRDTLQSPPGFVAGSIDVDQIMRSGTRLRRRRKVVRGVMSAAILAAVVGGLQTTGVLDLSHRDSVPAVTVTTPPPVILETGLKAGGTDDWVIRTVSVRLPDWTKRTFGFALNERAKDGELSEDLVISEVTEGEELKPGFHAPEHAYTLDGGIVQPAYGYFVGSPAKITGTVDGKSVTAQMTTSSVGPSVKVFWFDNTKVTGDSSLTQVTAYDATGRAIARAPVYTEGQ
jgi:hypothetical protein